MNSAEDKNQLPKSKVNIIIMEGVLIFLTKMKNSAKIILYGFLHSLKKEFAK